MDNQSRQGIEGVGHQVEEKAAVAHKHYQGLSKSFLLYDFALSDVNCIATIYLNNHLTEIHTLSMCS